MKIEEAARWLSALADGIQEAAVENPVGNKEYDFEAQEEAVRMGLFALIQLDATIAGQETLQKALADHVTGTNELKKRVARLNDQLAESRRREQAADKCYNCDYKATVGCHCPYATWRGPQKVGDRQ